ncbi:MAG: hypothetical protein FJ147_23160 [Deltaproteobacteria bacterium]|nr:hypothetical protein [Deltaproteobacteria bacterium]
MRPTRLDPSKIIRRPAASKTADNPRMAEGTPSHGQLPPTTPISARSGPESGVVVIRRKGKPIPPVTAVPRGQAVAPPRRGGRKVVKKAPPPPPPPALYRVIMERWPIVFPAHPEAIRPLTVGIHELLEKQFPDRSPEQIRRAIAQWRYPRLGAYLRAVARGGARYDLDGNPCGDITESEKENARQRLQEWRAKRKAQAAAAAAMSSPDKSVPELTPMPLPEATSGEF